MQLILPRLSFQFMKQHDAKFDFTLQYSTRDKVLVLSPLYQIMTIILSSGSYTTCLILKRENLIESAKFSEKFQVSVEHF